jgi:hypothetical protein
LDQTRHRRNYRGDHCSRIMDAAAAAFKFGAKHSLMSPARQVDMSAQLAKILGQTVLDRKEQVLRLGMSADDFPDLWLFQNAAGQPLDDSKVRKVLPGFSSRRGWRSEISTFCDTPSPLCCFNKGNLSNTSRSNSGIAPSK